GPLGTQWAGPVSALVADDGHVAAQDAYTGFPTATSSNGAYYGTMHGSEYVLPGGTAGNPFTGAIQRRFAYTPNFLCNGTFGRGGWVLRAGSEVFWYDPGTDSGGVYWPVLGQKFCAGDAPGQTYGSIGSGVLCLKAGAVLMSKPDVENWAYWGDGPSRDASDDKPINRVGINFGAPGDYHSDTGTLWLEYPPRDPGISPNLALTIGGTLTKNYHHSSRMKSSVDKRVEASNVTGLTNLALRIRNPVVARSAAQSPVVDGVLNDSCWDGAGEIRLADDRMNFDVAWLRYDASNLYVAMRNAGGGEYTVHLSNRDNIVPSGGAGSGEWVVSSYARFTVNNLGVKKQVLATSMANYSSYGSKLTETAWSGDWTVGVSSSGTVTVEIAIPWSTVEAAGLWKENLIVNLWGSGYRRLRTLYHGEAMYNNTGVPVAYSDGNPRIAPCTQFSPLFLDAPRGDLAQPLTGSVRLYFAETEGATAGQRVFDVKINGQLRESSLDVSVAAGGADRGIVREYTGVEVSDDLAVALEPKSGDTILSGVEFIGSAPERQNQAPIAAITASAVSGPAPLTITLDAGLSRDQDGQIAKCEWSFGDGVNTNGWRNGHAYLDPGVYTVFLRVTDNDGATATTMTTITVSAGTPGASSDFACRIRATGGDYSRLSQWQAAIVSDLTSTNSRVFGVSDRGTYDASTDDGQTVTFAGGGSGLLRHINADGKAYITGCSNALDGVATCPSGHTFTLADAGGQIVRAVAECYNDWPTGLQDSVGISNWVTSAGHYVVVRSATGHRHNCTPVDGSGNYTGFAVVSDSTARPAISVRVNYTVLDGLIIGGGTQKAGVNFAASYSRLQNSIVYRSGRLMYGIYAGGPIFTEGGSDSAVCNTLVIEDQSGTGIRGTDWSGLKLYNVTVVNGTGTGVYGGPYFRLKNVLASGNAGGDIVLCQAYGGYGTVNYSASSDGTADDRGGTGNRINQVFKFVNATGRDFHLAADDTGAVDCGTAEVAFDTLVPVTTDVDGEARSDGMPDIGADEAPDTGVDAYGIPDSWKIRYFGSATATGTGAMGDPDGDGMNNLSEYVAGTSPVDPESRFQCSVFGVQGGAFRLSFGTVTGRIYGVVFKSNLFESVWHDLTNGVHGTGGQVEINDYDGAGKRFYRINVRLQ
ncbi:MAG: hypothetical protein C0404_12815, partial [Verrucomicrobia bacterium]|nr:hypothetical protein [Verrucomicrobiota bacterium]